MPHVSAICIIYMPGKWYKHLTAVRNLGPAVCKISEEHCGLFWSHRLLFNLSGFLSLSSSFIFILLQAPMFFKLPFIAAVTVFVLPVIASGSLVSLPLPPNVVVFSGKDDAFFTSIVSTLLSVTSIFSFLLLRCISRLLLTVSSCQYLVTSTEWSLCSSP